MAISSKQISGVILTCLEELGAAALLGGSVCVVEDGLAEVGVVEVESDAARELGQQLLVALRPNGGGASVSPAREIFREKKSRNFSQAKFLLRLEQFLS